METKNTMYAKNILKNKTVAVVILLVGFIIQSESQAQNTKIENFRVAKKLDYEILKNTKTVYCSCNWSEKSIDKSCGVKSRKDTKRFFRTEIEHLVPVSYFSHLYANKKVCRSGSARTCAEKTSAEFNLIEADLHNHAVAHGEVNGLRSDKVAMELPYGKKEFQGCDTKFAKEGFEPQDADKGKVARAYLYMSEAYKMPLESWQARLYQKWDNAYPPSKEDCLIHARIARIQGNENRFVAKWCGTGGGK